MPTVFLSPTRKSRLDLDCFINLFVLWQFFPLIERKILDHLSLVFPWMTFPLGALTFLSSLSFSRQSKASTMTCKKSWLASPRSSDCFSWPEPWIPSRADEEFAFRFRTGTKRRSRLDLWSVTSPNGARWRCPILQDCQRESALFDEGSALPLRASRTYNKKSKF